MEELPNRHRPGRLVLHEVLFLSAYPLLKPVPRTFYPGVLPPTLYVESSSSVTQLELPAIMHPTAEVYHSIKSHH